MRWFDGRDEGWLRWRGLVCWDMEREPAQLKTTQSAAIDEKLMESIIPPDGWVGACGTLCTPTSFCGEGTASPDWGEEEGRTRHTQHSAEAPPPPEAARRPPAYTAFSGGPRADKLKDSKEKMQPSYTDDARARTAAQFSEPVQNLPRRERRRFAARARPDDRPNGSVTRDLVRGPARRASPKFEPVDTADRGQGGNVAGLNDQNEHETNPAGRAQICKEQEGRHSPKLDHLLVRS